MHELYLNQFDVNLKFYTNFELHPMRYIIKHDLYPNPMETIDKHGKYHQSRWFYVVFPHPKQCLLKVKFNVNLEWTNCTQI